MILSDKTIRDLKIITPFREENLQPASYDLTLNELSKQIVEPGESVLLVTKERVSMPANVAAMVKSKSSFARDFVYTDFGGWIDPGYIGNITVALTNAGKEAIDLREKDTFCQLVFWNLDEVPEKLYDGHYQNSDGLRKAYWRENGTA